MQQFGETLIGAESNRMPVGLKWTTTSAMNDLFSPLSFFFSSLLLLLLNITVDVPIWPMPRLLLAPVSSFKIAVSEDKTRKRKTPWRS